MNLTGVLGGIFDITGSLSNNRAMLNILSQYMYCCVVLLHEVYCVTKPVLSGHLIKRTPSIERTVAEVPKFISLIYFK